MKTSVNDVIPQDVELFYGVRVRGAWRPSEEAMAEARATVEE